MSRNQRIGGCHEDKQQAMRSAALATSLTMLSLTMPLAGRPTSGMEKSSPFADSSVAPVRALSFWFAHASLYISAAMLLAPAGGCSRPPAEGAGPAAVKTTTQKLDSAHLPNAWRLTPKVISGGQPDGEAAFEELHKLGVKTIISVDGAKPNAALARKHALRYVHLPHGYDGISAGRVKELAKAVRDLPGPIYIHCHHGKHRSPASAAVACVSAGLMPPDQAVAVLQAAGTSPNYQGLYSSAAAARRIDDKLLDQLRPDFRESVEIPPMAEAMVGIEHMHDRLLAIGGAGWKPLAKHPDLDPAHEALLLKERFTELLRTEEVQNKPARFLALLRESEADAERLEATLRETKSGGAPPDGLASGALTRITNHCAACHRQFRDNPRGAAH